MMGKPKPLKHMTPEEARDALDTWARGQNEIARHNQRVLTGELAEYAEQAGGDWRALGGLEAARKLRSEDAAKGRASRRGSDVGTKRLRKRTEKLAALLIPLVRGLGLKYPEDYFRGEKFRLRVACTSVLDAGLPEPVREFLNKETLSLTTLAKHTKAALAGWTRTDRDREMDAPPPPPDLDVRRYRAERRRRGKGRK